MPLLSFSFSLSFSLSSSPLSASNQLLPRNLAIALGCVRLTPEDSSSRRSRELFDVSSPDNGDGDGSRRSSIATPAAAAATTALSACGSEEPPRL